MSRISRGFTLIELLVVISVIAILAGLAASRSAARLERVDQLADSGAAGRLQRVRLRGTLESDVRGLAGVLRAVELGEAALSITDLRIVAVDPSSADRAPEVVRLELTVAGWFLTTPKKQT